MDILVVVIDSQDRLKQQNALLSVPDSQVGPWLKVNKHLPLSSEEPKP